MLKLLCVMSALQLGAVPAPIEMTADKGVDSKRLTSVSTPSLSMASANRLREFYKADADNTEKSPRYIIKGNQIVAKLPATAFNKSLAPSATH